MPERSPPPGFDPDDIIPPLLNDDKPWPILSIALDVSGRCNMACRYCAEAATQPPRAPMAEENLESAWHLLHTDEPRAGRSIRLGSGEPLLALPLLHQLGALVARADEPRPRVYVTTNGTLLTSQVRDWLVEAGWDVKISLDGPKAIHDKWRVTPGGGGTFDQISEAVIDLAERIPPSRFSVTTVLCGGTDPEDAFEGIAALGVRRIELVPVVHTSASVLPTLDDIARYEQFVMAHARRYFESDDWAEIPVLAQLRRHIYRLMGYNLFRASCGAGRSFVGVGPDGDIYPCFRFVGVERYRIGRLPDGVDPQAAAAFQRGAGRPYQDRAACRACWAAPLCGGPCFACAEMFGPGNGQPVRLHCAYEMADARAAVWLVGQLRQHNPDRLLAFLPRTITEGLL